MLEQSLVVARKEIKDHLRETRSVWASVMHLLLGPMVVSLVLFSLKNSQRAKTLEVVAAMSAIFLLVSAFTGGMNVSMDLLAGERERRSLLPLLLNPVSRVSVVVGKWLAITMFAACGTLLTLAAFTFARVPVPPLVNALLALIPLAALAAAIQLAISTVCRTAKEAQTYLSLLVFAPMAVAMFMVFLVPHPPAWLLALPILGQQALLAAPVHAISTAAPLLLSTIWCTIVTLLYSASLLKRDDIVYGR